MGVLKIKFVDFWFGFDPGNNYFFRLLSLNYATEICDDPEILIFGCYGVEHLKYDCIKIFYTAENMQPDFSGCDFAIGFDYNTDTRYYRLPLYAIYVDYPGRVEKLTGKKTREEAQEIWRQKTKFCCMVVSNGESKKRLHFFEKLSSYKTVDSGGKVLNNVGGPVHDKMLFIQDYRFVISFENTSHPGYTTEKIVEPFLADCIPVYWGDPFISKEFNTSSFLHLRSSAPDEDLINEIISIDNDEEKAIQVLMQPKFINAVIPDALDKDRLMKFFNEIIHLSRTIIPVSKTWRRHLHLYRVKKQYYINRVKGMVKKKPVAVVSS